MLERESQLRDIFARMEQEFHGVADRYISELKELVGAQDITPESPIDRARRAEQERRDRTTSEREERQRAKEAVVRALNTYTVDEFSIKDLSEKTSVPVAKLRSILSFNRDSLHVRKHPYKPLIWQKLAEPSILDRGNIYDANPDELRTQLREIITSGGGYTSHTELASRLRQRGYDNHGLQAFLKSNGPNLGIRELTEDEKTRTPRKSYSGGRYSGPVYTLK